MTARYLILLGVLLLSSTVYADVRYVDDTLYLGFYDNQSGSGKQFSSVPSGTVLELLQSGSDYSLVRTERGTEGWVKTKYLVSEPPASVRIKTLEQVAERADALIGEVETLTQENVSLREQLESLAEQLSVEQSEAEKKNTATKLQNSVDQRELDALKTAVNEAMRALKNVAEEQTKAANQTAQATIAESEPAAPAIESSLTMEELTMEIAWQHIVHYLRSINFLNYSLIAVAAFIGFLLGMLFLDRRIRHQHGGYRPW